MRAVTARRSFLRQTALGAAGWIGAALSARRGGAAPPTRDAARRVFAAGPPAAVLVHVLAPHALLGWPGPLDQEARAWLGAPAADLPVLGRLAGRGSTASLEALVALKPDLIVDVGSVDDTRASTAERVRAQTGVRCELLGGRLAESPALLRRAGDLLGVAARAERLAREAERILEEVERGRPRRASIRVYLARGSDGLETGRAGSLNAEVLELVGARNVAAVTGPGGLLRVSPEQVLAWDPEVVLTQDRAFARAAASDPFWRTAATARPRRVLLAPTTPFGWIDAPPGINRLIGLLWLARRLDPRPTEDDLRARVRAFYDSFYGIALDEGRLDRLLGEGS